MGQWSSTKSATDADNATYLIVGAGVFGASTARELRKTMPSARVTLVDRGPFPNPNAASHDLNKIVRTDYEDIFYMRMAIEAQNIWRNDPLYKPWYHESGIVYVENTGMNKNFIRNYETLGEQYSSEMLTSSEARERFDGVFRDSDWSGVTQNYFNPRCGWGEGAAALHGLVQAGVDEGVSYRSEGVSRLSLNESGACTGVILGNGEVISADKVILATGSWTPWLLAESAPHDKRLHTGDRLIAAGAVQCRAVFPKGQKEKLRSQPVLVNYMLPTQGESIPPDNNDMLKFNYPGSFTYNVHNEASDQEISVPPSHTKLTEWSMDVPAVLKKQVEHVMRSTYGQWIEGLEIDAYRTCWDSITLNQDFVICPHPHSDGLYIAAGGSFHSWKLMPVLGRYVVRMLQGTLDEESTRRWGWDRPNKGGALPKYLPKRDLKDLMA